MLTIADKEGTVLTRGWGGLDFFWLMCKNRITGTYSHYVSPRHNLSPKHMSVHLKEAFLLQFKESWWGHANADEGKLGRGGQVNADYF